MSADDVEAYRASFARRSAASAAPGQTVVREPGICGVLGSAQTPGGRLLVTDDRALPTLRAWGPEIPAQIVNVFEQAARCRELLEGAGRWDCEHATAMLCPDLSAVTVPPLAAGLTIVPVHRVPGDPADGVPLEDAAVVCLRADPATAGVLLPAFVTFLRSLPASSRLFAAIDADRAVRATAGASAIGSDANAYFVSTDMPWRGRGVATVMTAAALAWTRDAGARIASLDASTAGVSIYARLGFRAVGANRLLMRFVDGPGRRRPDPVRQQ